MIKDNNYKVAADPAKSFFVSMLIKDITLRDAIGDLVDNSVDAIKAIAKDPNKLDKFEIEIDLSENHFSITDNGIGMEAKVARETAFNFGKSDRHKLIKNSIGQFGIGMKRAFFKLGNNIKVQSVAKNSSFELTIDVPAWLKSPKVWEFEFNKGTLKEEAKNDQSKTRFSVYITELSEDAKLNFSSKTFITTLQKEIALEHILNINKGLRIKICGYTLKASLLTLVHNEKIKPTYWEKKEIYKSVKVLAGISTKDSEDGGWYIFCNNRLILGRNKTEETVWTGSKGDGVPLWHAQFHMFRGFVFFEAKDSSQLPWNTTKTGMDMDSPYYQEVRAKMILMTKQVMKLLNDLKTEKEKDNPEENQKLNKEVEKSLKKTTPVVQILAKTKSLPSKFSYPEILYNPVKKEDLVKISYQVSIEKFDEVKDSLGVSSPKEVGLETFNYYCENEL